MKISGESGNEAEVSEFVRTQLLKAGANESQFAIDQAHRKSIIPGNTGNLIFKLAGTYKAPRRLLSSHLDTVPICVGSKPVIQGDKIVSGKAGVGIGADNRAGVAATLLAAIQILQRQLPHPPLTFCWFVQEEVGLQGSQNLTVSKLGKPQEGFNWDGGSPNKLTIGATGAYRMNIAIDGIASHAGNAPEDGVSATAVAALAIAQLQQDGWHGDVRKKAGIGTSNVGIFRGGNAANVVTDRVEILAEARSHNPKFRKQIVTAFRKAFEAACKQVKNSQGKRATLSFTERLDYDSFLMSQDSPCVKTAMTAVQSFGLEPELAIANGGLDANWLNKLGIPTVSLGCGQKNQHMATESLDIPLFHSACEIALRIATGLENPGPESN